MPDVDLAGQGNGAASPSGALAVNIALAATGGAAGSGTARINGPLAMIGQGGGQASGPGTLGVALTLRNHPAPFGFFTGIAQGRSTATGSLTQAPSPLGVGVSLKGSAGGRAGAQARLAAQLSFAATGSARAVAPSVRLAGVLALVARGAGSSSNYGRSQLNRLLAGAASGQASASGALTT